MALRRTGPPERKTPLVNHTPLTSSTPLSRSTPLPRSRIRTLTEVRASRRPVSREEREARRLVRERSGGGCEGCPAAVSTDWSHRVARSRGGEWAAHNGLALCRRCHQFCHDQPEMARSVGWVVRTGTDSSTVPALLHGRGWTYLTADGCYRPAAPPTEGDAA